MKKIIVVVLLNISVSLYSQSNNYSNKGFSFFLGFGTSVSTTISPEYSVTLSTFGAVGYAFNERLMTRLEYQYIRFTNRSDSTVIFEEIGDVGNLSMNVIRADIMYGRFEKCGCLQWYVNLGPGLYPIRVSTMKNNETISDTETNFGIGGGGGFSLGLIDRLRLYFEIQYNQIFNDGTFKNYIPFKMGFNYNLY